MFACPGPEDWIRFFVLQSIGPLAVVVVGITVVACCWAAWQSQETKQRLDALRLQNRDHWDWLESSKGSSIRHNDVLTGRDYYPEWISRQG
jgi:hypothetical protein